MKRPNPFDSQHAAFAALAKIWEKQAKEIAENLLTINEPKMFEKSLDRFRHAVLQHHICKGLASFTLQMSRRYKP